MSEDTVVAKSDLATIMERIQERSDYNDIVGRLRSMLNTKPNEQMQPTVLEGDGDSRTPSCDLNMKSRLESDTIDTTVK